MFVTLNFSFSFLKLKSINTYYCEKVTSIGVTELGKYSKNLEVASFGGCFFVNNAALTELAKNCIK